MFRTTFSILDSERTRRRHTLSEDKLQEIVERLETPLRKSSVRLAQQTGVSVSSALARALPFNIFKIHFNIILLCTPRYSKWVPSFSCSHKSPVWISRLSHAWHMNHPLHLSLFDYPTNILRGVQSGVACWPLVPKFAGSNLTEAVGFLRAKYPQHAFLRKGSKAVGPMS